MAHEAPLGSVQQAWVKLSARTNGLGDALPNPTYSHHPAGAARGLVEVACSPQGDLTQEETKITGLPEAFGAKRSKRKGAAAGMAPAPGFGMHCPPLAQGGAGGGAWPRAERRRERARPGGLLPPTSSDTMKDMQPAMSKMALNPLHKWPAIIFGDDVRTTPTRFTPPRW